MSTWRPSSLLAAPRFFWWTLNLADREHSMTTMSRRVEGVEKYWDAKFTSGTRLLVMCKVTGTGSMRSSDVARYYLLLNRSMLCCRLSDLNDSESIRGKKVGSPRVVSSHSPRRIGCARLEAQQIHGFKFSCGMMAARKVGTIMPPAGD